MEHPQQGTPLMSDDVKMGQTKNVNGQKRAQREKTLAELQWI